ncbi:hypothetical protein LTR56_006089 [Elasticomyces elasticus]|nr:hypothetical protein LTR56_006089 [Elasticomyces elasticus]KAK3667649.1 hypothetical protein LTR22_001464 [Elasticomyces elasticus]KAK4928396.1 hypothetical protein LTR49_004803 [Elasticomyces elasticus]KAK5767197.1 hypothetical protein LTS12_002655 [Elasticomyces elasticus]
MATSHHLTETGAKATLPSQWSKPGNDPNQTPDQTIHSDAADTKSRAAWLLSLLEDQWFLIALGILIAIASQVQVPESHQHVKSTVVTYLCVSVIFFITGGTLDTQILLQNYARWKLHLFVQVQCFLGCSAVVFGVVSAAATDHTFMDPGLLVGLIFFSCVATTISSNVVMTKQAGGNQALTVVQTTIGNLLGVFITPALVVLYTSVHTWYNKVLPENSGQFAQIYQRVLKQLGLSVYVPLVIGQLVRTLYPLACKKLFVTWHGNKLGSICLLLIIWQTYDSAFRSRAFESVPGSNIIFVTFIGVALWLSFFFVALLTSLLWLPRKDVISVCYCVPAKGPAMGVPLATTIFAGLDAGLQSKIQIPIVIYQGIQIVFGSIMISIFRRWMDSEKDGCAQTTGSTSPRQNAIRPSTSARHDPTVEDGSESHRT